MNAHDPRDTKARADARLEAALEDAPVRDPRPAYRQILKYLKESDADAYGRAVEHFQSRVLPACVEGDPLEAWLSYGLRLAELLGSGRRVDVDATGRARPNEDPAATDGLLLFIPDSPRTPALLLRWPNECSAAQQATLELLVFGRQIASLYA